MAAFFLSRVPQSFCNALVAPFDAYASLFSCLHSESPTLFGPQACALQAAIGDVFGSSRSSANRGLIAVDCESVPLETEPKTQLPLELVCRTTSTATAAFH